MWRPHNTPVAETRQIRSNSRTPATESQATTSPYDDEDEDRDIHNRSLPGHERVFCSWLENVSVGHRTPGFANERVSPNDSLRNVPQPNGGAKPGNRPPSPASHSKLGVAALFLRCVRGLPFEADLSLFADRNVDIRVSRLYSSMAALDDDSPEARVIAYLEQELENGRAFVKSRYVASELDLSAKEVGQTLRALATEPVAFEIESWGGRSDGTTWLVERSTTGDTEPDR